MDETRTASWQLEHAITSLRDLERWLNLPPHTFHDHDACEQRYPMFATPYYLGLARSPQLSDPILRQCVPSCEELLDAETALPDPLGEGAYAHVPRLVHRYPDRALFLCCSACAVRCRHCMRKRHWADALPPPTSTELEEACGYIRHHPQIRELLISGGDPFMLPDDTLLNLLNRFAALPQIEVLRIGSRVPVTLPQRLTPEFCGKLGHVPCTIWLATHFNHPWEVTETAAVGIRNLLREGIPVVNQSVLLKGVNDDADTLRTLFTSLLKIKVKPYYLFHGDPVQGTTHFRTGLKRGLELMDALRCRVSGLALPTFAFDLPEAGGKIRLEPQTVLSQIDGCPAVFQNFEGKAIAYDAIGQNPNSKTSNS